MAGTRTSSSYRNREPRKPPSKRHQAAKQPLQIEEDYHHHEDQLRTPACGPPEVAKHPQWHPPERPGPANAVISTVTLNQKNNYVLTTREDCPATTVLEYEETLQTALHEIDNATTAMNPQETWVRSWTCHFLPHRQTVQWPVRTAPTGPGRDHTGLTALPTLPPATIRRAEHPTTRLQNSKLHR